jgi:methionyl-tRNA formyltransferase
MNIHPSMLPRLRGADPLFDIVDKEEDAFGLTFHKVVDELDSGPVYLQVPLSFSADETYDELYFRVLERIHLWLPRAIVAMNANPDGVPQQGEPTRVRSFKQGMRLLNLSKPFAAIRRRALACYSHHPMAFSNGKLLMTMIDCVKGRPARKGPKREHGEVVRVHFFSMTVAHGDDFLRLRGIRFWRKPGWMTPLLLPFLCRPGQKLNSREETREMIRHRERL